ncbi:protein S-acyltransferase 10-like isoform X3 [Ipomoea triloba]|uniref:protein S-acyltransferase 10-like isoform X3 n=1 Tax=Ipomoea triloba TaxID=35885 RepID=UPI00125D9303|nr:protein S-acyltransferase 10-like isoform X3 [Ipomoea triloba]
MGAYCGNLLRDIWRRLSDRCLRFMPCLSDPVRRTTVCLRIVLMMLHVVFAGVLFALDAELIEKARQVPWYFAIYYLLFIVTLVQYFITSASPPGYVHDVTRAVNDAAALHNSTSVASKQPASSKNGSAVITIDRSEVEGNLLGPSATPWAKLVMNLYPYGASTRTWTCTYCQSLQPPRTKHCHDCDKCVLEFDHHCVWLGTCIGQGNHCQFWWYICEETALSFWTGILYIQFLKSSISKAWYVSSTPSCNFILILFCAFLVFPVLFGGGELERLKIQCLAL